MDTPIVTEITFPGESGIASWALEACCFFGAVDEEHPFTIIFDYYLPEDVSSLEFSSVSGGIQPVSGSATMEKTAKRLLQPFAGHTATFLPLIQDAHLIELIDRIFLSAQQKDPGFELQQIGLVYEVLARLYARYQDVCHICTPTQGRM